MNLQEMTLMRDEELVMLAHEGNPEAVDFLMEKYKPLVRKKAACPVSDRRRER